MKKKNGFLTFCFAFIPGAGQMYLGYMHRGLSIVGAFALITMAASFFSYFGLGVLAVLLPIIWMYSFFDTFRIASQTPEEAAAKPDAFLLDPRDLLGTKWRSVLSGRHKLVGAALIAFGVYMLYRNFAYPILQSLIDRYGLYWLDRMLNGLPVLLMAFVIIALGAWLIRGPVQPADDYTAYIGTGSEEEEEESHE